jgi:prepilin-type N-terminal cleavage/methylation domain-containing protein
VSSSTRNSKNEGGFTLLEMVVAVTILTVGLLGTAAAIGYALMASNHGRKITNTKLLIVSVLEQTETLRDTGDLTFAQIANAGNVDDTGADHPFAGFPTGFQPISTEPGQDGIYGTADDLVNPGPDGIYGTADDFTDQSRVIQGATRQIAITSLSSTLKRIEVTVTYTLGGKTKQIVGVSYLNDDAHSNYIP